MSRLLSKYSSEFNDGDSLSAAGYSVETSGLVTGDAEVLYSIVREEKPRRIIEVGAGGSSQVIAAALRKNHVETGEKAALISIDPYPQPFLRSFRQATAAFLDFTLLERPVQRVEPSAFESLGANDILFVDSSHVHKIGSDVEYEFLCVYPVLREGVLVHIHDVFVPFDYPLEWNTKEYWFWNEQYFLETFLSFNDKFSVLASLSMVDHTTSNRVFSDHIKAFREPARTASFWMRAIR